MAEESSADRLNRRTYIESIGAVVALGSFAGCTGGGGDGGGSVEAGEGEVSMGQFVVPEENVVSASELSDEQRVGTLRFLAQPQSVQPDMYEACQIFMENVSNLGIGFNFETMQQSALFDENWFNKEPKDNGEWWDLSTWDLSPRPSRLDPNELLVNRTTAAQNQYNMNFWENEEYDQLVDQQQEAIGTEERQEYIKQAQEILATQGADNFLVFPNEFAIWNTDKWEGLVEIPGLSPANMLTYNNLSPQTDDEMLVGLTTRDWVIQYISPFGWGSEYDLIQERMIYDRLQWPAADGGTQNRLAREVNYQDDTTVEIPIRQGHTFHDGSEVLAEDVKYSYEIHKDNGTSLQSSVDGIIGEIEIADDHRLIFNLERPYAPLGLYTLARVMIGKKQHWEEILASDEYQNADTNPGWYMPDEIIGSGPMEVDSVAAQEGNVTLLRNDDHFDPIDYEGRISQNASGVQQALGQMANGTADITLEFGGDPRAMIQFVESEGALDYRSTPAMTGMWLAHNCDRPPGHIEEFRRALFYGWDTDSIVNNVFQEAGSTALNTPISPVLETWYNEDLPEYDFDLQAAADELVDGSFMWDEDGQLYMPEDRVYLTEEEVSQAVEYGYDRSSVTQ